MKVKLVHWFYSLLARTNNHMCIDIELIDIFYFNERTLVDCDKPMNTVKKNRF